MTGPVSLDALAKLAASAHDSARDWKAVDGELEEAIRRVANASVFAERAGDESLAKLLADGVRVYAGIQSVARNHQKRLSDMSDRLHEELAAREGAV